MRGGDTEKYAAIVQRFQRPIYIYCRRLLNDDSEAEDAAQDIFVKAYQSLGRYEPTGSFSSWLYSIAYRHCLNLLRRSRIHRRLQILIGKEERTAGPETDLDERTFSPRTERALRRLSAHERSLLILNVFEERTSSEIAAIVGHKPETVKKRIGRAKRKLRAWLEQEREDGVWTDTETLLQTRS